jgi:hypothetical protein
MTTTATRTDVHAPASAEFDPSLYDYRAAGDYGTSTERPDLREANAEIDALQRLGYQVADHQREGRCGHCGARHRYFAVLARHDVREILLVGEQCLGHRFDAGLTKADFQALRAAAGLDRKAQRKLAAFRELCDAHPALAYADYAGDIMDAYVQRSTRDGASDAVHLRAGAGWALSTLVDIAYKARKHGQVSPKQVALVERLLVELDEKVTAYEAELAAKEEEPLAPPAPTGRVEVEGEVVHTKWQENDFGGALKMLVVADAGWRVYASVPTALCGSGHYDEKTGSWIETATADKGDRVAFTATLERSRDDESFAFAKRPTKARFVSRAAA